LRARSEREVEPCEMEASLYANKMVVFLDCSRCYCSFCCGCCCCCYFGGIDREGKTHRIDENALREKERGDEGIKGKEERELLE